MSLHNVRSIWILQGGIMRKIDFRCTNCIIPNNYPKTTFDEYGECNSCKRWKSKFTNIDFKIQEDKLNQILSKYRSKNKMYDCIIGLSGGKDSSYAALVLKEKGMNPLGVTFDNGLMSKSAYRNIYKTVEHLSLGHIVVKHNWNYMKNLYKHFLLNAGEFCSVCNVGIRVALYRVAKQFKINLLVSGRSMRTEAYCPEEFFTCSPGYFYNVSKTLFSNEAIYEYMFFNQFKRAIWQFQGKPAYLELPIYIPWVEEEMLSKMKNKLDWEGLLGEQHSDCLMNDAKELLKLKKFGVIELTAKVSSLVLDKQISRQEALDAENSYIKSLKENEDTIKEKITKTFSITESQLNESITKSHVPFISTLDGTISKTYTIFIRSQNQKLEEKNFKNKKIYKK